VAIDSVEEMGLGLLIAAFVLWLLGQITFDMTVNPRQNHCEAKGALTAYRR